MVEDIYGLEFGSKVEAIEFYDRYAMCHGFAIQRDDAGRDLKGNIIMRQLVCNRASLRDKKHLVRVNRKRKHRPITITNCPAKLRVHYVHKTRKWKLVSFVKCHNHELTPNQFVHLIPKYRGLFAVDKSQVDSLHSYGVRTYLIMGYRRKRLWTTAYMRDKFFAGIRTTSQCKGINSFINRFVGEKNSLVEFMHNFDHAVKDYRQNEVWLIFTLPMVILF